MTKTECWAYSDDGFWKKYRFPSSHFHIYSPHYHPDDDDIDYLLSRGFGEFKLWVLRLERVFGTRVYLCILDDNLKEVERITLPNHRGFDHNTQAKIITEYGQETLNILLGCPLLSDPQQPKLPLLE